MTNWEKINEQAIQWIKEAGSKIRASFLQQLKIETKTNRNDLVTNMDKETEQFFIKKLMKLYTDHRILGEEGFGDVVEDENGVIWVIDPIDGTMNFVHQQRNFAISIGIYEDGIGQLGYIYDVVHDELYHARKGFGAFLNDQRLSPLSEVEIEDAVIGVNALWVTDNHRINRHVLGPLVQNVRGTRSYGSAAMEIAYVASGRLDSYITMRLSPWDFAGGKVIVEEVGGVVTSLTGEPLTITSKSSVFISKPGLHQKISEKYLRSVELN
ncbi:inositol monophosphatase [Bacillus coahuilensis m2-6]|uniref:inositol monophosphatase family protein n=1 Tax=Bacillus coahuilensis TaxID=408580 RepID=UPI0007500906|nr:inositol monophosphatase family protein [Bacillus coahuilensis]KUP08799.1 inositol monophosphatase [Bacillus coahuilensis m2-6]